MHPDVIGVRVELAVVAVGDDHLRSLGPDDAHQPLDRLVERRVREVVRVARSPPCPSCPSRGSRACTAARSRSRRRWPGAPAMRTSCRFAADLGRVDGRVEDVALLAAGAAHEHAADALGGVLGDGARALRRFVVGVGVDREETEGRRGVDSCGSNLPSAPGSDARSIGSGAVAAPASVDLDPTDVADPAAPEPLERERRRRPRARRRSSADTMTDCGRAISTSRCARLTTAP